jgi:hypothetical protein
VIITLLLGYLTCSLSFCSSKGIVLSIIMHRKSPSDSSLSQASRPKKSPLGPRPLRPLSDSLCSPHTSDNYPSQAVAHDSVLVPSSSLNAETHDYVPPRPRPALSPQPIFREKAVYNPSLEQSTSEMRVPPYSPYEHPSSHLPPQSASHPTHHHEQSYTGYSTSHQSQPFVLDTDISTRRRGLSDATAVTYNHASQQVHMSFDIRMALPQDYSGMQISKERMNALAEIDNAVFSYERSVLMWIYKTRR